MFVSKMLKLKVGYESMMKFSQIPRCVPIKPDCTDHQCETAFQALSVTKIFLLLG